MNSSSSNRRKYITDNRDLLLRKYRRLLNTYTVSCGKILAMNESQARESQARESQAIAIPYPYYVRHIKRLVSLLQFINQIYRITFKKDMPQINMFDKRTTRRYQEANKHYSIFIANITGTTSSIYDENMLPIAYYNAAYYNAVIPKDLKDLKDSKYIIRFSHSNSTDDRQVGGGDYSEDDKTLLYSTILHRSIRLSFVGSKIAFNGETARKYTDSLVDTAKYMSILPSHISLNIKADDKDTSHNDVIPLFGVCLVDIIILINKSHSGFQEAYEIIHDNKGYEKQYEEIKEYSDDATIRTILYTINNNNNNADIITKYGGIGRDYYYWFKYDSPLPAITVLDTLTYLEGIPTFQPFKISPRQLTDIIEHYIGKQESFSKIVNSSIQDYIANGIIMEKDAHTRVRYLLNFCSKAQANTWHNKKPIYVFHGTHMDFTTHNKELVLTSFLSCTFNINIAMKYAYENLKNNGVIYIIEVAGDINYINFYDPFDSVNSFQSINAFKQIILLPGLRIKVTNVLYIGGVKYNFCKVHNIDKEYIEILYNNIFEGGGGKAKLYKIKSFKIRQDKAMYPQAVNIDIERIQGDPSYTLVCLGKQLANNITTDTYFNLKYTLHQHFISDCYKFFNINAVEYALYYDSTAGAGGGAGAGDISFYTGYKNDSSYEVINVLSKEYGRFDYQFERLFIDSLLHNDEVVYPKNYMKNKANGNDYKLFSLGKAGLFNYEGYKKLNIDTSKPSLLYMNIILLYKSFNLDKDDPFILFIKKITRDKMKAIISKNIGELKAFRYTFLDTLKTNYIDFIERNMGISNTTEEYKDLIDMFNELTEFLRITADYYIVNMENGKIYSEIEPHIYDKDMKVGGKSGTFNKKRIGVVSKYITKHLMMKDIKEPVKDIKDTKDIPYYDNKGYAMTYEDFMKVIEKYKAMKKKKESSN